MSGDNPRLRLRVWVEGELIEETWVDTSGPDRERLTDAASQRHKALTDRADREGRRWLVETFDPALPEEQAYVRFGTDKAGMVEPLLVCPFCEAKVPAKPGADDNAVVAAHWAESPSCGQAWADAAPGLTSMARDIEAGGPW